MWDLGPATALRDRRPLRRVCCALVASSVALGLHLSPARADDPVSYKTVTHRFPNCAAFNRYVAVNIAHKTPIATTDFTQRYGTIGDVSVIPDPMGGEPTIIWRYYFHLPIVVTMPRYVWPKMTDPERAAVQSLLHALRIHEDGHVELAHAFLHYFPYWGPARGLVESGLSDPNVAAWDAYWLKSWYRGLLKLENAYDKANGNGRWQSQPKPTSYTYTAKKKFPFPRGPNITWQGCPR